VRHTSSSERGAVAKGTLQNSVQLGCRLQCFKLEAHDQYVKHITASNSYLRSITKQVTVAVKRRACFLDGHISKIICHAKYQVLYFSRLSFKFSDYTADGLSVLSVQTFPFHLSSITLTSALLTAPCTSHGKKIN
jgi:hypothetical protein